MHLKTRLRISAFYHTHAASMLKTLKLPRCTRNKVLQNRLQYPQTRTAASDTLHYPAGVDSQLRKFAQTTHLHRQHEQKPRLT
jgi:hypothetical protein